MSDNESRGAPAPEQLTLFEWPRARNPRNLANWTFCREKESVLNEVYWCRPEDLEGTKWPKPVVLVTGAFDVMHAPHMRLLFTAREKAGSRGTVIVAMNSDASVRLRKGVGRPVMHFPERAAALAYMPIDMLVEFDTEDQLRQIAVDAKVDLQVCGPEYYGRETTAGVPVLCIREGGPHTTTIIERIKNGK